MLSETYDKFEHKFKEFVNATTITDKLWLAMPMINFLIYMNRKPVIEYNDGILSKDDKREIALLRYQNRLTVISNFIYEHRDTLETTETMKNFREMMIDIMYVNFYEYKDNYYSGLPKKENYLIPTSLIINYCELLSSLNIILGHLYTKQFDKKADMEEMINNHSMFASKLLQLRNYYEDMWLRLQLKPY